MTTMTLQALHTLVMDDTYASSFQSIGQYRGALLRQFDRLARSEKSFGWGRVETVGDMVRNLMTLDQAGPIFAAFHTDLGGKRVCRTRPVSISRERVVDGKWVDPARTDVPYVNIVWANQDEPVGAQQAHAGADDQDANRLEFMMEREAWIAWGKDGESCRLFHRNEDDGEPMPMLGWGARHWSHDPREAIDAAIRAAQEGDGP